MNNISIRRAGENDAALLSRLSAVTFAETFSHTCRAEDMENYIAENYDQTLISKELQDPDDFYFIAYSDDKPVGYLRIKEDESVIPIIQEHRSVELKRIYVLKEYYSKRIGAALMNFVLQLAKEKNYELMWLGVWEHNERAKNFYKKYEFVETGFSHPFPIGNTPQTDIWLYKMLTI